MGNIKFSLKDLAFLVVIISMGVYIIFSSDQYQAEKEEYEAIIRGYRKETKHTDSVIHRHMDVFDSLEIVKDEIPHYHIDADSLERLFAERYR